jgi:hypothetical protein
MRNALIAAAAALLAGCATAVPPPADKPCGVIEDALADVRGRTPEMDRRIDAHHARGVAAGCWNADGRLR